MRGPRSIAFHERAEKEAGTVAQLLEEQNRFLTLAQACRTDLEDLRRGTVIDASTERYLSSRLERLTAEAKIPGGYSRLPRRVEAKVSPSDMAFLGVRRAPPRPPRDPLAAASRDRRLVKTHEIRGRRGKTVAFSPDGKTLAIGCTDHRVELVDTDSGKPRMRLDWPEGLFYSVAFSPDGSKLAGAVSGESTSLWDLSDGRLVWTRPSPAGSTGQAGSWITTTTFSPDGQSLAVADNGDDESSPPVRRGTVQTPGRPDRVPEMGICNARFLGRVRRLRTRRKNPGVCRGRVDPARCPDGETGTEARVLDESRRFGRLLARRPHPGRRRERRGKPHRRSLSFPHRRADHAPGLHNRDDHPDPGRADPMRREDRVLARR